MRASYRVKNENKTCGFIIDNRYVKYYDALHNIDLIDNLTVNRANVIRSKRKKLKEISIKDVNRHLYKKLQKENYLVRDIEKELKDWKNNFSNYVLYLSGARQTGKTTELLKFAYKNYDQIIYINLAEKEKEQALQRCLLSNSLVFGMTKYCREMRLEEYVDSDRTILIIDEIQINADIYNHIRSLQSELNCHVAITGSYLGKTLNTKYFKPAGNTRDIEMLPLSFREFCRANDKEQLFDSISIYGKSQKEDYEILTALYKIYLQIGGYPAVVTQYLKDKNLEYCYSIIDSLMLRFTEESAAYFTNDKSMSVFDNVYKATFLTMAKEKRGTSSKDTDIITNFVKEDTKEHVSRTEINNAISWLKYSKIIGSCDLYNQGNVNDVLPDRRFYFMDCGIANYIANKTSVNNDTVRGLLAETFVYDELYRLYKKNKFRGDKPCCLVAEHYELDFMLVDKNDKKYGIEVKSLRSTKHESLDYFQAKVLIDEAYLAEISRGGQSETIKKIPIYTISRFKEII